MTRGADLRATVRDGKRLRAGCLDARVVVTASKHSRIGFVVPKHGQTAVQRNRLKRRLRELTRTRLLPSLRVVAAHVDVVLRTLPSGYAASFEDLAAAIESLRVKIERIASIASGVATDNAARA